uniref:NBS-LRR disease resistance protein n=1 Tax=Dasypyrum villosum TaxID=40247 RepID=A0A8K1MK70_9POAL|nr:NBS-LRR disease resistance protein [Dasypyrum villosum]
MPLIRDIITSEAILILGVEEELTEVLRRVELIRCCIHDAEKRRTKELTVNNWLGQLRDVIYDVDEIMDVARSNHLHVKPFSVSSCFCNIRSRRDVAVRIRSLDRKIENISKDKIFLTFNTTIQPIRNGPTTKRIRSSNLVGVLRNIGVHHEQGETIAELQRKLAETIEGKSFFLVLDDVWHSNVWMDLLRPPLHETTSGVILITTRDDQITSRIGVEHTHRVDLMSVEVGWELLWKSMNIEEEKEVQQLRNTGIEIVRKCGHLPLAIKVTASALASRDLTENEWKRYLGKYVGSQSMLSDEIEGALYLSYDELPHRLKQCFLYCALYGEDSIIWRNEVPYIAEEYYYELIHRNLLQPDSSSFDQSRCKMHDLLRQLACNISREECFVGDKDMLVLPRVDKVEVKVRTFLTVCGPQRIEDTLFKRFLLLRKLIHLRLLNLDYTGISCLPESIGSLKNLQVLSLRWCDDLHSLPLAMTLLCSLRCLDLFGTEINQVPKGMGKLKLLTNLGGYPVWCTIMCASSTIGKLPNLKYLRIEGAYAVTKVGPEFAGFKKGDPVCNEFVAFPKLEWLIIKDMPNWERWSFFEEEVVAADVKGEDGAAEIRKDDAQPARVRLLPRLLELKLLGCPKLRDLPQQLGKDTPCLKVLGLIELNNLKVVEDLPVLSEVLVIVNCKGLERINNLPQVTKLRVFGCPNLSHVEGLGSLQQLGLGVGMQEISSH